MDISVRTGGKSFTGSILCDSLFYWHQFNIASFAGDDSKTCWFSLPYFGNTLQFPISHLMPQRVNFISPLTFYAKCILIPSANLPPFLCVHTIRTHQYGIFHSHNNYLQHRFPYTEIYPLIQFTNILF